MLLLRPDIFFSSSESENARWESDLLHSVVKHRRIEVMRYVVQNAIATAPVPLLKTLVLACITNQPEMVREEGRRQGIHLCPSSLVFSSVLCCSLLSSLLISSYVLCFFPVLIFLQVLLLMKIPNVPDLPPQYVRWAVRTGCIGKEAKENSAFFGLFFFFFLFCFASD